MDIATALAPLARFARRYPDLEGQVVWAHADRWVAQEDEEDGMDAEECLFFAEGLLQEGLALAWWALAPVEAPDDPDLMQLFVIDGNGPPPPGTPPEGSVVVASGRLGGAP